MKSDELFCQWRNFLSTIFLPTKLCGLFLSDKVCIKPGIQERGTEWGERGEWGGCPQTSRGMSSNIPGIVAKHSVECPQTFQGMLPNILENVAKHSGECCQTFRGMSPNILGNIAKHSVECPQTYRGMSSNIPENIANVWCKWRKILGRVAFRILSNIHDGVLRK